jgi:hypothetical protein
MELALYQSVTAAAVALSSTGIMVQLATPTPIEVVRFGVVPTTVLTANAVFELRRRPTAGQAAGEVVIATMALAPASWVLGTMSLMDVPGTEFARRIYPGQEVYVQCTVTAGAATTGQVWIDFQRRSFQKRDITTPYYTRIIDAAPANG